MLRSIENLNWRYATKKYNPGKKLNEEQLQIMKEALRLSPSSYGLQAWKFIHVKNRKTREKIREVSYDQPQITEASELFVLATPKSIDEKFVNKFIDQIVKTRGVEKESLEGYKKMILGDIKNKTPKELEEWLVNQVFIALGMVIAIAAENRIDTTPMEGFIPEKVDEILSLKKYNLKSRVILTLGFRSPNDKTQYDKKVRFPTEEVFIEI